MKKKLTIGDIAQQLNISKTTVSFVLNGKAREKHISEGLEKKILEHIEKVGYRPNQFAQGLRSGKTKIIGMMVEDISDPFFSTVARLIEESAYKKGYKIIYCSTENDTQKTKDLIQIYRTRQVDGYIIAPPPGIEKELNDLIDDNLPVVLFDRTVPEVDTNNVVVNNYEAAYDAIHHFIQNGYKNIAMVNLDSDQVQMLERQEGYIDALKRIKGKPIIKNILYHDNKENSIKEIQEFLSENRDKIDAVFFATNYIADNGLESIRNLNLHIPQDIGVIVFDDHNLYRLFTPPITAISQPVKEIAENVIHLMLSMLDDSYDSKEVRNIVLKSTLMIRNSSLARDKV
ncbi:Transcriptional regulator [Arcticibacter svalbardensis MN12-7]|uniref:Transcriptional regulator n=1 Tax=Arcticibacter svalbardensis MN12-7 TaxID=1150600 RepID=R9GP00_9SPHI|nr:substrate-binding domain-containing protein [Arcticibacter svalbardensis]EOR93562.1 Transcriptional regulator [Arcticibacter svalbardensis MN12-7]